MRQSGGYRRDGISLNGDPFLPPPRRPARLGMHLNDAQRQGGPGGALTRAAAALAGPLPRSEDLVLAARVSAARVAAMGRHTRAASDGGRASEWESEGAGEHALAAPLPSCSTCRLVGSCPAHLEGAARRDKGVG